MSEIMTLEKEKAEIALEAAKKIGYTYYFDRLPVENSGENEIASEDLEEFIVSNNIATQNIHAVNNFKQQKLIEVNLENNFWQRAPALVVLIIMSVFTAIPLGSFGVVMLIIVGVMNERINFGLLAFILPLGGLGYWCLQLVFWILEELVKKELKKWRSVCLQCVKWDIGLPVVQNLTFIKSHVPDAEIIVSYILIEEP